MTERRAFRPPYRLLAVAASLAVHLGAVAFALNGRAPEEQLAGAGARASVQIGQAFASSIAAGAQAGGGALQPQQSPTQRAIATEPAQALRPQPPQQSQPKAITSAPHPALKPTAAQAVQTAMAQPATSTPARAQPARAQPIRAAESQATTQTPAVPRPIARPPEITRIAAATPPTTKQARKQAQKQVEPKRPDTAARPARDKSTPGAGGKGRQTVQKGGSRGGAKTREAGNAASSNYPGLVRRKLSRSLRYPRSARRKGLTGEVTVGFTVQSSGAATGVRVVRSSGSPLLDQAALETVGRAAPFPRIPASTGKTRWRFTIPLTFR